MNHVYPARLGGRYGAQVRGYVRPEVAERVFRDASGAVVDYGNRWDGGSPPEDAYPVVSHSERFAPLWVVADALVDHLATTYDVAVDDSPSVAADYVVAVPAVVRAVRVTPAAATAAPLTFALTSFPGVVVHAGLLHDTSFPGCGCDACDETWQGAAEDLEELVSAVVGGRFGEQVTRAPRPWVRYALADEHGRVRQSGSSLATTVPAARRRRARTVLSRLGGPWHPWPRRG